MRKDFFFFDLVKQKSLGHIIRTLYKKRPTATGTIINT